MSPFRSESKEPLACASRRPHVLSSATKCAAELEEKRLSAFEPKARRTLHLFSSKSGVLKEKRFSTFEPTKWRARAHGVAAVEISLNGQQYSRGGAQFAYHGAEAVVALEELVRLVVALVVLAEKVLLL